MTLISNRPNYRIEKRENQAGSNIFYRDKLVARLFKKHKFYTFLDESEVEWKTMLSKRLLPDDALLVIPSGFTA